MVTLPWGLLVQHSTFIFFTKSLRHYKSHIKESIESLEGFYFLLAFLCELFQRARKFVTVAGNTIQKIQKEACVVVKFFGDYIVSQSDNKRARPGSAFAPEITM